MSAMEGLELVVIGRTRLPLVHEGEALYHVARFADTEEVADHVEAFQSMHDDDGESALDG